jgi:uncharacterized coiled-coil protein SlyX
MDAEVTALKEHLITQNKTIVALEQNSSLKGDIIANLRSTIASQDDVIVDMELQIVGLKKQMRMMADDNRDEVGVPGEKSMAQGSGLSDLRIGETRGRTGGAAKGLFNGSRLPPLLGETRARGPGVGKGYSMDPPSHRS